MTFDMNSLTLERIFLNIHRIVLDSVEFNISAMVYQHNYGTINIDDPVEEGLYAVPFTSIPYKLLGLLKRNGIKRIKKIVCNAKYMRQKLDQYIPQFLSRQY